MKRSRESSSTGVVEVPHLMKVETVAKRLNNSPSTIGALIESEALEHFRCPGIRIVEEQLAGYLDASLRNSRVGAGADPRHLPPLVPS